MKVYIVSYVETREDGQTPVVEEHWTKAKAIEAYDSLVACRDGPIKYSNIRLLVQLHRFDERRDASTACIGCGRRLDPCDGQGCPFCEPKLLGFDYEG